VAVKITPGNTDDRAPLEEMAAGLGGKLLADKGYIARRLNCDSSFGCEDFIDGLAGFSPVCFCLSPFVFDIVEVRARGRKVFEGVTCGSGGGLGIADGSKF
jgi:hypothetical protein